MVSSLHPRYCLLDMPPYEVHGGGGGPSTEEEMPLDLRNYLTELELWANANNKEASRDTIAFWLLKVPAIISSIGTGVLAKFEYDNFSLVLGLIAGICVAVDGIHPRGMLRNTHIRAFHDIRTLSSSIVSNWRTRNDKAQSSNAAKRIIKESEEERLRIANYIKESETALNYTN